MRGGAKISKLLNDAHHDLYPGSTKFTLLSFAIKILYLKVLNKWSNKSFDMLMMILKDVIPNSEMLLASLYKAKKFLRAIRL